MYIQKNSPQPIVGLWTKKIYISAWCDVYVLLYKNEKKKIKKKLKLKNQKSINKYKKNIYKIENEKIYKTNKWKIKMKDKE